MRRSRRQFSTDEKVKILSRRIIGRESVSDICKQLNLQTTFIYT